MDIAVFLQPVNPEIVAGDYAFQPMQLGQCIKIYTNRNEFPDLDECRMALIGVKEGRGSYGNEGASDAPDLVRKYLYRLYAPEGITQIVDLGNIEQGHTLSDTYFALSSTICELVKQNIIPIIIGGGQDLTYANYAAYEHLEQVINLVSVDAAFDLGFIEDDLHSRTFLSKIILHQPNYLFNYSNIGYQTYFVDPGALELMKKLFFDAYRLGLIRAGLEEVEPIVRNADIISIDMNSVRISDAPGNIHATPNGFYGEEICQIARYAGWSDKVSSFGIYEINPAYDVRDATVHLAAQMIWCFIEGVVQRKNDTPVLNESGFLKYMVVAGDSKHEIVFYKSIKSDRWWMDVPYPLSKKSRYERHHLVPCSYKDYQLACSDGLPDRWWKTYQKLI